MHGAQRIYALFPKSSPKVKIVKTKHCSALQNILRRRAWTMGSTAPFCVVCGGGGNSGPQFRSGSGSRLLFLCENVTPHL